MRLYCGSEDYVNFFEEVLDALELTGALDYEVEDVDGEYEIVIYYGESDREC